MSIKDDIKMVKEELNSEEKFFEKAVMTERFVKKYKNVMIGLVVLVVIVAGANMIYTSNEQSKITAANKALQTLKKEPQNKNALSELKELTPDLHDVWIYSQAVSSKDTEALKSIENTKAIILNDLVKYELSSDASALESYASKQDAIFRDLALVQSAVMLLEKNSVKEARDELAKVSKGSALSEVVAVLMHYGIK